MSELLRPDDTRDALRKVGGLLLGIGVLMWAIRKGSEWSDFVQLVIFTVPAVFLYWAGVFTEQYTNGTRSWQAVYSVFGLVFVPLALSSFVDLAGGHGSSLNTFWIAGVTAVMAGYAGVVAGVRFQLLLGAIAVIVSWSALWNEILSGGLSPHWGTYRGLLGILAIGLLAGSVQLWRTNPGAEGGVDTATRPGGDPALWKASELLTGAGIAAVLGAGLGFGSVLANRAAGLTLLPLPADALGWDIVLLLVSLGLVGIGSRIGVRGPVYVGVVGLLAFLVLAGTDARNGGEHAHDFGVWPPLLLILGALGVALSAVGESSLGDQPRHLLDRLRDKR